MCSAAFSIIAVFVLPPSVIRQSRVTKWPRSWYGFENPVDWLCQVNQVRDRCGFFQCDAARDRTQRTPA